MRQGVELEIVEAQSGHSAFTSWVFLGLRFLGLLFFFLSRRFLVLGF